MPSGAPEQVTGLLSEGLDIACEQKNVYIAYSEDQKWVTVLFEDGNEVTGSMLVGTDGPQYPIAPILLNSKMQSRLPSTSLP